MVDGAPATTRATTPPPTPRRAIAVCAPSTRSIAIIGPADEYLLLPWNEAAELAQAILDALTVPDLACHIAGTSITPPGVSTRATETPTAWRARTKPMFDAIYGTDPQCGRCGRRSA